MANSKHVEKLKKDVKAWNEWRGAHSETVPDLRGANLRGAGLLRADLSDACLVRANLSHAALRGADLRGADLLRADLSESGLIRAKLSFANLRGANLNGANLTWANLDWADLSEAELNKADLSKAHLRRADLSGTKLSGANLSRATIAATTFGNNDLSETRGLETVFHWGPSTIGIDTLYNSHGQIPLGFLRGAGVPDNLIEYVGSLTGKALEFYSCFISYSTKDQAFADRLYADLQNKGVRCWFAPHDVQGGRKLHEQIDEAIRLHDKLLLILSPHSMESEWVKTEIAKARKRELRDPEGVLKRRVLFPIRLAPFATLRDWECFDADTGKDSAREIREYFIPDFSNWKDHDSYQEAFQRLISDLKASDSKPK